MNTRSYNEEQTKAAAAQAPCNAANTGFSVGTPYAGIDPRFGATTGINPDYCFGQAKAQQEKCDAEPRRETYSERVSARLNAAERDARHAERLRELKYLLEKNPETTRILDLIEETRP